MSDTIREFADSLCLTEIVSQTDMDAVLEESAGAVHDPQELSEKLAERGLISAFQAERLNHGEPLVIDDYVLLQELGAGGMGRVFKARHPPMARTVVIKIIKEQHATSPDAVNRFTREIKAIANLDHPNIVRAYHAGMYRGSQYLVMEYVEGEDLARHARNHDPLSVATVVDYLIQAATGLADAHQQGIVHRDVKPGNLMLDADGRIRVLDLGLAKPMGILAADPSDVTDAVTGDGDIVGTSAYMAPEQSQNSQDVDHRSDIYSLGCTLHFLLTCAPVYSGTTAIERIIAHRTAEPPALSDSRDDVTAELEAVFQKMIAKRPEDRFQSMTEVIDALRQAMGIEQDKSQSAKPAEESDGSRTPPTWNLPVVAATLAATLIVCVLLAIAFLPDPDPKITPPGNTEDRSDNVPVAPIPTDTESDGGPPDRVGTEANTPILTEKRIDRIAAEAVIAAGGHVRLVGMRASTYAIEDLPDADFRIEVIDLSGAGSVDVPFHDFGRLSGLDHIDLARTDGKSADMQSLGQSQSLRTIFLSDTGADDAAIESISRIPTLENLDLKRTAVTAAGLAHLKQCSTLITLFLGEGSDVTDAGLQEISQILNLKKLTLSQTGITDDGLEYLVVLGHLETLDLSQTDTADAGLLHIGRITGLQELYLRGTDISNAGLQHLAILKQLHTLDLSQTQITDGAIPHISPLTSLRILPLDYTQVTIDGVEDLRELLPLCDITSTAD